MTRLPYRRQLLTLVGASALAALAAPSGAQTLAAGVTTIVVPYPAGGVSDLFARAIAPTLGKALGRTVVVENVTGASGSIAATKVLGSPANGSVLLMGSPTEVVLAPLTIKGLKYQATDFRLIELLSTVSLALYVRGDMPANTLDDFLAYARRPGAKAMSYGSTGLGSSFHLAGESFRAAANIEAVHVPYRGGMPMLQDLMSGIVDMALMPADGTIAKLVDSGRMKALAVASATRSARFPNVATFAESQSLPRLSLPTGWVGVLVAATTPEPLVVQLHKAMNETLATPEVRQALEAAGSQLAAAMPLAQSAGFLQAESSRFAALVKAAKLEPN